MWATCCALAEWPEGQLSAMLDPELVDRITNEVAILADYVLRMCFRAFDYLPPLDLTFGDFLRALVTADYDVSPRDPTELRFNIIEAFRERGTYADVESLAEKALLLRLPDDLDPPRLDEAVLPHLAELFVTTAGALDETARPEPPPAVSMTKTARGPSSFESYERQVGEGFEEDDELQSDASIGMTPMYEDLGDRDEPTRKRLSDDSKVRSDTPRTRSPLMGARMPTFWGWSTISAGRSRSRDLAPSTGSASTSA